MKSSPFAKLKNRFIAASIVWIGWSGSIKKSLIRSDVDPSEVSPTVKLAQVIPNGFNMCQHLRLGKLRIAILDSRIDPVMGIENRFKKCPIRFEHTFEII